MGGPTEDGTLLPPQCVRDSLTHCHHTGHTGIFRRGVGGGGDGVVEREREREIFNVCGSYVHSRRRTADRVCDEE